MRSRGIVHVVECGPGKVLAGLARRIDKSLDARAIEVPFMDLWGAWALPCVGAIAGSDYQSVTSPFSLTTNADFSSVETA